MRTPPGPGALSGFYVSHCPVCLAPRVTGVAPYSGYSDSTDAPCSADCARTARLVAALDRAADRIVAALAARPPSALPLAPPALAPMAVTCLCLDYREVESLSGPPLCLCGHGPASHAPNPLADPSRRHGDAWPCRMVLPERSHP